jgi:hypothetical protein
MHFFDSSRRCCASIVWITTNECLINTVLSSPDGTRSSAKTTPSVKNAGLFSGGKALNRNVTRPALRDDERKALHRSAATWKGPITSPTSAHHSVSGSKCMTGSEHAAAR